MIERHDAQDVAPTTGLSKLLASLSSIEVKISAVQRLGQIAYSEKRNVNYVNITKKSLKGLYNDSKTGYELLSQSWSNRAWQDYRFDSASPSESWRNWTVASSGKEAVHFVFKYYSKGKVADHSTRCWKLTPVAGLQQLDIIARPQPLIPLEERDPDMLTSAEMAELIKKMKTSQSVAEVWTRTDPGVYKLTSTGNDEDVETTAETEAEPWPDRGAPGAKRGWQEFEPHDEVTEIVRIAKRPTVTIVLDD